MSCTYYTILLSFFTYTYEFDKGVLFFLYTNVFYFENNEYIGGFHTTFLQVGLLPRMFLKIQLILFHSRLCHSNGGVCLLWIVMNEACHFSLHFKCWNLSLSYYLSTYTYMNIIHPLLNFIEHLFKVISSRII